MNVRKSAKGFTLVEMLVVIAIIAILAAALFPAIQNAMDSAKATALKNKGRGIWVAVTSTNSEREPLNLTTVWPDDMEDNNISDKTAKGYFNWLLSTGDGTTFDANSDSSMQVCSDLARDGLIASGIKPAAPKTAVADDNIAWGIVKNDTDKFTATEVPFIFSKDFSISGAQAQPTDTSTTPISSATWNDKGPFAGKRIVWVTRGGATKDARKIYLTQSILMGLGDGTARWTFDTPTSGSGSGN